MTIIFYLALFLFMLLCGILCLVVLVQESKSMGLGASFGGDSGESLFGTSTADVLKKLTAWLGLIFIVSSVLLSIWSGSMEKSKNKKVPITIEQSVES